MKSTLLKIYQTTCIKEKQLCKSVLSFSRLFGLTFFITSTSMHFIEATKFLSSGSEILCHSDTMTTVKETFFMLS